MSFIFLWAFADKTFGLGMATVRDNAWINGGSPTSGFLLKGTSGPLAEFFQGLANVGIVDWLFMLGLLGIGLGLLMRRYVKWAVVAGIIMMLLMYLATFPPENNPLIDEHIIYMLVLAVLAIESRRA
jgi:thiosulfate dehydrogenase [quinone] large subunit